MTESTETENRRRPPAGKAADDGDHRRHEPGDGDHRRHEPGIDLPVVGHVPYKSVVFVAGLGIAGAAGVIEWPVAAAVGLGYALSRR
jgi:hypothetical protein